MPSASQIIDQMAAAYLNCTTYSDTGTVTTVFKSADGNRTQVKQFATAMVRPSRFRFEFTEEEESNSRYIVWRAGNDVRSWWTSWNAPSEAERAESLGLALAGATGVSSGSAHTVPALLMPDEVGGRLLTDLHKVIRGEDDVLHTHNCFTIEGLYADRPIKIWLDQQSLLIRRIDGTRKHDSFTTVRTATYDPVIDQDVPPSLLEYNAPE